MRPDHSGPATAIIVAAGRGARFGAPDKVLLPLAGRPLLSYSVEAAEAATAIEEIIIVAGLHTKAMMEQIVAESDWTKVRHIALGGDRRQDSVEAGLRLVSPAHPGVAVHDAARPFVTAELFDDCLSAADRTGAAIAAVPVVDTLKRVQAGFIIETIPRDNIWAAQTPQAFLTSLLRTSFAFAHAHGIEVTDEARLFEIQGLPVEIISGSHRNLKITRPEDFVTAEAILQASRIEQAP